MKFFLKNKVLVLIDISNFIFDENFTAAKKVKRQVRDEYFKQQNVDPNKSKAKPKDNSRSIKRKVLGNRSAALGGVQVLVYTTG